MEQDGWAITRRENANITSKTECNGTGQTYLLASLQENHQKPSPTHHYLRQLYEYERQNQTKPQSSSPDANQPSTPLHYLHQLAKRDLPFIYQRDKVKSCTNAASTSIISGGKAVDFAAFAAGILTLVINVNNNINNNNNNNNNLNINAVDSSNVVANFNTNNANQVDEEN